MLTALSWTSPMPTCTDFIALYTDGTDAYGGKLQSQARVGVMVGVGYADMGSNPGYSKDGLSIRSGSGSGYTSAGATAGCRAA